MWVLADKVIHSMDSHSPHRHPILGGAPAPVAVKVIR